MYPSIENFVGNTPLVRLQRIPGNTSNVILAKLEGNNPAGSVKDRPALSMIRRAEERGEIKPGDTLIEATSGNTGIALAFVCAARGYRLTLTPTLADQEIRSQAPAKVTYWEGQVKIEGVKNGVPVAGLGYAELTGYAGGLGARF